MIIYPCEVWNLDLKPKIEMKNISNYLTNMIDWEELCPSMILSKRRENNTSIKVSENILENSEMICFITNDLFYFIIVESTGENKILVRGL